MPTQIESALLMLELSAKAQASPEFSEDNARRRDQVFFQLRNAGSTLAEATAKAIREEDERIIGSEGRKRAIVAAQAKAAALDPQVRNLIGYVSRDIET